jgi:hypothetical protein
MTMALLVEPIEGQRGCKLLKAASEKERRKHHLTAHGKKGEGILSQSGAYPLQESLIIILSDFLLSTPARNALILYLG